jgi:hypothetical protein
MKKNALLAMFLFLSVSVVQTYALTPDEITTMQQTKEATKDAAPTKKPVPTEKKKMIVDKKCEKVMTAVDASIAKFNDTKDKHISLYNNMKDKLAKIEAKLKEGGKDTTKLVADQKALDEKITKLASDYSTYITKLESSKDLACGKSDVPFKIALKDTKQLLEGVRKDAMDIRDYYKTTIYADMISIMSRSPVTK